MTKILVTGSNSYVGKSIKDYLLKQESENYIIDELNLQTDTWEAVGFESYDVVFHVAGIAHSSPKKKLKDLYYKVNRDLAIKVSEKAKNESVKQFIFMSSMLVYGEESIDKTGKISLESTPSPDNFYGDSKLQAEIEIQKLNDENFTVSIIRTPIIYGKDCKGNFPLLIKLAKKWPIYPDISNKRSMMHIENFAEFIRQIIINRDAGLLYPSNLVPISTNEIIRLIRQNNGKKMITLKVINPIYYLLSLFLKPLKKIYSSKYYSNDILYNRSKYNIYSNEDSIKRSL